MFNTLFLFMSFLGVSDSQTTIETLVPPHPCQENSCENESFLTINSPNGVSTFELVAQQLGVPVTKEDLEQVLINRYSLSSSSTDFEFMMAVTNFFNQNLHSSWSVPETNSGVVLDPVYSLLNFSSTLCGDFVSNGIILVNRIRTSVGLPRLIIRKAGLNGHTVMEYYDNQHQKWVYFDLDGAGGHLVVVSDDNGFYASIEEIRNNPSLVLSSHGIVLLTEDGLGASCVKDIFYDNANSLFQTIDYIDVLDEFPDLKRTGITIDEKVTVQFYDRTGDYWWFDTTGLLDRVSVLCDNNELAIINAHASDSGCGPDFYLECLYQGVAEVNGYASVSDLLDFVQEDQYFSYQMGNPMYRKGFKGYAESFSVTMLPGEYDSLTNYYVGYLVKKITPEIPGIDFMFNNKIYNNTFEINKYVNREDEGADSIFQNPRNLINEVGYAASIPVAVGSVKVEYYLNYHTFAFMDTIQNILVESGNLVMNQTFKYDEEVISTLYDESNNESMQTTKAYPNPCSLFLNINTTYQTKEIVIYDLLGRVVLTCFGNNEVDIRSLSEGFYVLKVNTDNGIYTTKIERKN